MKHALAMSKEQIAKLRALHEAATPGPWHPSALVFNHDGIDRLDANLIANMHNFLPELLQIAEEHALMKLRLRHYIRLGKGEPYEHFIEMLESVLDGCPGLPSNWLDPSDPDYKP